MPLAVENRIFEPSTFAGLVLQKAVRQREPQRADRSFIQLPKLGAAVQIVRGGTAHAFPDSFSLVERLHDFLKSVANRRNPAGIASEAVNREFVGAQFPAPFDEAPGFLRGEITGGEVAFNERQVAERSLFLPVYVFASSPSYSGSGWPISQ